MDQTFHRLMNGTFNVMKGPILSLLMVSIVISLARRPPGRLP